MASQIHQIDIGNEASAFVEVLVGRTGMAVEDYQVGDPCTSSLLHGPNCKIIVFV